MTETKQSQIIGGSIGVAVTTIMYSMFVYNLYKIKSNVLIIWAEILLVVYGILLGVSVEFIVKGTDENDSMTEKDRIPIDLITVFSVVLLFCMLFIYMFFNRRFVSRETDITSFSIVLAICSILIIATSAGYIE